MKTVRTEQSILFQCDYSGKAFEGSELPADWYELEVLNDVGMLLFSSPQEIPGYATRHLVNRKVYHFSSLDNARNWLMQQVDETLREIKPPPDRKNVSLF